MAVTASERLAAIRARIGAAAARAGRRPEGVRLVAVGKGLPADALQAFYEQGQRDFADNRADALAEKARALPADARWHFIGNLQRNKLKRLAEVKPLVHSFDRPDLAPAWPAGMDVLVQVHLGGGAHRNGLPPEQVEEALRALDAHGVRCVGLSLLPPPDEDARPHFRRLRGLRDALAPSWPALRELSMGMSDDFEEAVEEGATMVRVGRALFGQAARRQVQG